MITPFIRKQLFLPCLVVLLLAACGSKKATPGAQGKIIAAEGAPREVSLLNVSYDPTREFYEEFNRAFAKSWFASHNQTVTVRQSHGGSGKQARAIIDGLEADVATLALAPDIDALGKHAQLVPANWATKLPNNSAPYTSTVVFLVRKGNPKAIRDWSDLTKEGVSLVTPNPKTSGGARWAYLAAWGYALRAPGGNAAAAKEFVRRLYSKVAVLDAGARAATASFVQNRVGDVLLTWENEAHLILREAGGSEYEIVAPSISILAEPSVAVVEDVAKRHNTEGIARAYLQYLYSEEGQQIAAKHFYRPRSTAVLAQNAGRFPALTLFTVQEVFGGWARAQQTHFAEGGTFDQIYSSR